jgi:hypothetical protein
MIDVLPKPMNSAIVLSSADTEMLRIEKDGFYVRGVKVPVDDKEAIAVYNCFNEWLAWNQLQRTY